MVMLGDGKRPGSRRDDLTLDRPNWKIRKSVELPRPRAVRDHHALSCNAAAVGELHPSDPTTVRGHAVYESSHISDADPMTGLDHRAP